MPPPPRSHSSHHHLCSLTCLHCPPHILLPGFAIFKCRFSGPSTLYRVLAARHKKAPPFLHRTVDYIRAAKHLKGKSDKRFKLPNQVHQRVPAPSLETVLQRLLKAKGGSGNSDSDIYSDSGSGGSNSRGPTAAASPASKSSGAEDNAAVDGDPDGNGDSGSGASDGSIAVEVESHPQTAGNSKHNVILVSDDDDDDDDNGAGKNVDADNSDDDVQFVPAEHVSNTPPGSPSPTSPTSPTSTTPTSPPPSSGARTVAMTFAITDFEVWMSDTNITPSLIRIAAIEMTTKIKHGRLPLKSTRIVADQSRKVGPTNPPGQLRNQRKKQERSPWAPFAPAVSIPFNVPMCVLVTLYAHYFTGRVVLTMPAVDRAATIMLQIWVSAPGSGTDADADYTNTNVSKRRRKADGGASDAADLDEDAVSFATVPIQVTSSNPADKIEREGNQYELTLLQQPDESDPAWPPIGAEQCGTISLLLKDIGGITGITGYGAGSAAEAAAVVSPEGGAAARASVTFEGAAADGGAAGASLSPPQIRRTTRAAAGGGGGSRFGFAQALSAPKRTLSSYMLFGIDTRPRLWKEHPDLKQTEVMSMIGQLWREMREDEKEHYTAKAKGLRDEYDVKMKEYKVQKATRAAVEAAVMEESAREAAAAAGIAFANRKIEFEFRLDKTSFRAAQQDTYSCPWCSCGCWGQLQALLMHLTLCHPRMIFTYEGLWDRGRIVVSIAESRADRTNPSDAVDMVTYTPLPRHQNSCFVMKGKRRAKLMPKPSSCTHLHVV